MNCLRSRTNKLKCWGLEIGPRRDQSFGCIDHPGNKSRRHQNNNHPMIEKPWSQNILPALCDTPLQAISWMPKKKNQQEKRQCPIYTSKTDALGLFQ